jgi:hypothetical protein
MVTEMTETCWLRIIIKYVIEHIDQSAFVGLLCTFTAKHLKMTTTLSYYTCSA